MFPFPPIFQIPGGLSWGLGFGELESTLQSEPHLAVATSNKRPLYKLQTHQAGEEVNRDAYGKHHRMICAKTRGIFRNQRKYFYRETLLHNFCIQET